MEQSRISCEKARNISIVKTLERSGHFPTKKSEKEAWFLSPLRSETQASFKVSLKLNRWYDHGLGKGGNVIDLVIAMNNCSVREALDYLSDGMISFSFHQQPIFRKTERNEGIRILRKSRIENPGLISYLQERKIPMEIARRYCREVHYRFRKYEFFAIGLENHLGGWELRNRYFKISSSPKSYTWLKNSSVRLLVTEGMFDFLSLATLDHALVQASDCVVLNSISFVDDIKTLIGGYSEVLLYLDNDPAGKRATNKLLKDCESSRDMSWEYSGYSDLNDQLKSRTCES